MGLMIYCLGELSPSLCLGLHENASTTDPAVDLVVTKTDKTVIAIDDVRSAVQSVVGLQNRLVLSVSVLVIACEEIAESDDLQHVARAVTSPVLGVRVVGPMGHLENWTVEVDDLSSPLFGMLPQRISWLPLDLRRVVPLHDRSGQNCIDA